MDYEKKYKEALQRAKEICATLSDKAMSEYIFPELKESEDERIRKWLIGYFHQYKEDGMEKYANGLKVESIIAWLEKQGEFYTKRDVDNAYIEGMAFAKDELEKQGEQKPVFEMKTAEESLGIDSATYNKIVDECIYGEQKPADKIKPKFHKGDWIVWQDKCYKVNYNGCGYELVDQDGLSTSLEYGTIDENAHLWDVTTDAKDGDVLYCKSDCGIEYIVMNNGINCYNNIDSYFRYNSMDGFGIYIPSVLSVKGDNIVPATKEQRDLLFQKMHEAGYEWDAEKKEVKKIEQKPTDEEIKTLLRTEYEKGRADAIAEMQKPAWSEEDEEELDIAISTLKEAGQHDSVKWLKSLKGRVQPKQEWSKEDESIALGIEQIVNCASLLNIAPDRLNKVRDWLKSINERVQPKEELSEENARLLDNCISLIEDIPYTEEEQNWLKSLRPQNRWKPSDEQMKALHDMNLTGNISYAGQWKVLIELYNDLKTLKEY